MRFSTSVWSLLVTTATVKATQCAAPPLNLPIRSSSSAPGTFSHGVPIYIGTPPQQIVLTPSLQVDTTFIPLYTNSCIYAADTTIPTNDTRWESQDGATVCARIYGGGFLPGLSTSFQDNRTNDQINEPWFRTLRFAGWRFIAESFSFADYLETYVQQNEALPEKRNVTGSFILPDEGASFGGLGSSALSLTPDSKSLEALYAAAMVPSKSWSLTNESLCLGCIDESMYTGEFQAFKPSKRDSVDGLPCLLQTQIEALEYHLDSGSLGVALVDKPFTACIDPGVGFLVLPSDAVAKLPDVVGASVKASSDDSITFLGSPKKGSSILRFKLDDGLEVVVAIPGAGGAGGQDNGEWTLPVGTGIWGAYGESKPVLGKPFTDAILLRWDGSSQEYGMANRNPVENEKINLKPLGCDDFRSTKNSAETTPNIGIIVGSIVGGFLAGLLFTAASVYFFWRGQRGVKSKYEAMRGDDAVSLRTVDTGGRTVESRMSGTLSPPKSSIRSSLRSHFGARSVSPMMEPYLVDNSQVYEAPEGGTGYPTKRDRSEITTYSYDQR